MTISTTTTLNRYTGNGSTTVFPYTYRILAATDLVVTKLLSGTLVPATLSYPADYSVSGVGNASGGSITLTVAPATGDLLVIERVMAVTQPTSIRNNGSYFAETHENVFDRQTMVDQQHATALGRTFSLPKTIDPATFTMQLPVPVSGQVLAWTPTGLTNATVSPGSVVLPGAGRTTDTLSTYLSNNYVYNVLDYEADPTGGTDTRAALQSAWVALIAAGGGVLYFPTGTYFVNSYASGFTDRLLDFGNAGSALRIAIVGAPGAVITTPLATNASTTMMLLSGNLEDCVIEGLEFRNTHGMTANRTLAIDVESSNTVKRLTIRGNVFKNHARTIALAAVDGAVIHDNQFLFTNGRDSGNTNLADPNVCIWCFVNSSTVAATGIRIVNNYMDGCTSGDVSANTNKQGLDGFVYGAARGWYIAGNYIRRAGNESIYIGQRQSVDSAVHYPASIIGNVIDCTRPTGDTRFGTWGIRSDEMAVVISANALRGCDRGILVSGNGLTFAPDEVKVTSNIIDMTVLSSVSPSYGIKADTVTAPFIEGNVIGWASAPTAGGQDIYGVMTFGCANGTVRGNKIRSAALPSAGTSYGIYTQQTSAMRFEFNEAEFMTNSFYEHQHTGAAPGNRVVRHTSRSCTNKITGDSINELYVVENVDRISTDRGDASYTILPGDEEIIVFATTLTANRTVTLTNVASNALVSGRRHKILRTGLGAFTLTVQTNTPTTLKVIPNSTAAIVEVMIDTNGNWIETGYQPL